MKKSGGTSRSETGRRRSRDRRADTKLKLLDAAEDVFGRLGFHDASVVQITEKAGVALGTFYVHFPSKTDAFRELVRARRDELRESALQAAAAAGKTHREMMRVAFRAFFDGIAKHRGAFRLIREAEFVDPSLLMELYERPAEDFRIGLDQAMIEGTLPKHDTELVAWSAAGMAEFVALRWIIWGDGVLPDDKLDAFVEALLRLVDSPEAESAQRRAP